MLRAVTRRGVLWLALSVAVLGVVVLATAWLNLSTLVRHVTVWQLQTHTGRAVTLAALDVSLADGRLELRGLQIVDHDGGPLAEIGRLQARFDPWALLRGTVWIQEVALADGHVRIVRTEANQLNVADLLQRPPSSGSSVNVAIDRFALVDGRLTFEDRMLQPARTWHADLRLHARDLTTRERRGTAVASVAVAGALVTARIEDWQLAPAHLRAHVNVRDLDLRLATLYLPDDGPLHLHRGGLSAGVVLVVDGQNGLHLDADALVEGLTLRRRGTREDTITAPRLDVLVRELHRRPGAMALRYASLGGDVAVLDPTQTPPRPFTFSDLTVTASGLEQPMKGLARIAAHANIPGGGEVDVTGTAGAVPRRADLRVRARGLALAVLGRSLPLEGRLAGTATADVRVVAVHDGPLDLTVTGDATLHGLAIGDGVRTLAGAGRVRAGELRYRWPARLDVGHLTVTEPVLTVERAADGTIGLATLLRGRQAEPADELGGVPSRSGDIRIARLEIDEGRADIADASRGARVQVTGLRARAHDLAWPGRGPATVEVAASVAGARVSLRGSLDVAERGADLGVTLHGADLGLLQPWLPIPGRVRGTLGRSDLRVNGRLGATPALTVRGAATFERVALTDGSRPLAEAGRVVVSGLDYTWPATLRADDVAISQPSVMVERDVSGAIGLATLVHPPGGDADPSSATPEPDIVISRLRIEGGRATIADAAVGGRLQATAIRFTGHDVAWPARGTSPVRLAAAVAGGRLTARGTVDGAQRSGEIAVTLRGGDLAVLQPWLPIVGRLRGAADADVTVSVGLEPVSLGLRGAVTATDVAFLDATRPLLTVGRVQATGIDLRWPERLAIDRLHVTTPWAQIDRTPEGELSLRALFRRRPDRPGAFPREPGPAAPGLVAGLEISVREAVFDNGGTSIVDDAVEPAARFEVRGSRLTLRDLTWPAQGPAAVQLSTPMPGRGVLKAQGTFSIEPTRLQLTAELDQVDLAPGRPYLPIDARVSGRVTGRARIDGTFGDTIRLTIEGDTTIDRLALGDAERRLATARRVELHGLRYRYPASVRVRHMALHRPWVLVERGADGQLEIVTLLNQRRRDVPAPAASQGQSTAASAPAAPMPTGRVRVAINRLSADDGFLRFVDRTTDPDYAEELTGIVLTAERIGTNPRRHGSVDLHGTFASETPLAITGRIGSFTGPPFLDLTVAVKEFPVPRLNPYLDRLSAWVARQGVVTASLRYKLDGDELEASNEIRLTGLELDQGGRGDEVQQRIGLPLGLLTSLLKNRQGEIELDIPVRGRLSAPDFDYSEAVWAGLRGLAIKVVSLPFSWIGQMLYTEDARIESVQVFPVPFQTGRPTPTAFGGDQIQRLGTFLQEQPAIRLRLRPVTTVDDVAVLRRQALDAQLAAAGPDPAARRQAALALYAELFPRRQPPASDEVLFEELTRETPTPPRALRALARERTAAIRDALIGAGVPAGRLEPGETRAAVEAEGEPRVEFEIVR